MEPCLSSWAASRSSCQLSSRSMTEERSWSGRSETSTPKSRTSPWCVFSAAGGGWLLRATRASSALPMVTRATMGATLDDDGRIVVTTSGYVGDQDGLLAPGAVLRFTADGEPDGSFSGDGVAPTKLRNLSAPSFDGSLVLVLGDGRGCECRRLVTIDDAGVRGSVAVRFDRRRPAGVIADASGITLSGLDRRYGRRIVFAMRRLPDGSKDASFGAGGLADRCRGVPEG